MVHLCVGSIDPLVEIVMMPERRFKLKPVKTDFKSKNANPFYGKDFKMYVRSLYSWTPAHMYVRRISGFLHYKNVKETLLDLSGSVLTLTVFDHDYIKKNKFCGMVVINCAEIPRLPSGSSGLDDASAPQWNLT